MSKQQRKPPNVDFTYPILNEYRASRIGRRHIVDLFGQNSARKVAYYRTMCGLWLLRSRCRMIKAGDKTGPFCKECRELHKGLRVAAILMDGLHEPWKERDARKV